MMKRIASCFLFSLSAIWLLMSLFKFFLAANGEVDFLGRGPTDHIGSGLLQLILAGGAFLIARKIRYKRKN
jgi:hypothetical protein